MTAIAQALSAALLHFIWQGTLMGFLLWLTLSMLRNRPANERYAASCAALALMAGLPALTACIVYGQPGAVRIPNLVNGRATIEKYLKKNKAVLVKRAAAISA